MEKQDITDLKSRTKRTEDLYILLYRNFQEEDPTIYVAPFIQYTYDARNNWRMFYSIYDLNQEIYTDYKMTKTKCNDSNNLLSGGKSFMEFVKAYSLSEVDYLNGTHYAPQSTITLYDLNEACKAVRRHEGLDNNQPAKSFTKTK